MLMRFSAPLVEGRLLRRYKRFLADVELRSGETVTAHCANPGSMLGLAGQGSRVWLSRSNNPKRKLAFSWELIEVDLGTDRRLSASTHQVQTVLSPPPSGWARSGARAIPPRGGSALYGGNSRIDILLEDGSRPPCYVEVKNVHLMREAGLAEFPDSVTARGAKHLKELSDMAISGARAVMVYFVQRGDAEAFALAEDIDPAYAAAFHEATVLGVEALALASSLTLEGLERPRAIPLVLRGTENMAAAP